MRPRDRREVWAGWGDPENAIIEAINASPYYARTAFWQLQPLAIFGMRSLTVLGSSAEVWCFGTSAIDEHRIAFLRASKYVVQHMLCVAPVLTNYVDVDDGDAIRWLNWLGACSALPPQRRGGKLFAQFLLMPAQEKEHTCQRG
jgi:hypothetical protein